MVGALSILLLLGMAWPADAADWLRSANAGKAAVQLLDIQKKDGNDAVVVAIQDCYAKTRALSAMTPELEFCIALDIANGRFNRDIDAHMQKEFGSAPGAMIHEYAELSTVVERVHRRLSALSLDEETLNEEFRDIAGAAVSALYSEMERRFAK
jgi:hypothetical protein